MSKTSSPLRYPGGKHFLADFFEEVLEKNHLSGCTYVEPFAGGAGAGLSLLFRECVSKLWINDASYSIFCFWYALINESEHLLEQVRNCDISLDTRERCVKIINDPYSNNIVDIGFSMFFLNRVNRGGILNAGPIGGYDQLGKWKIDARFNKANLLQRLEMVSSYSDRIIVTHLDGVELLKNHIDFSDSFAYIDPPYFKQGRRLYHSDFSIQKHYELGNYLMENCLPNWILTYDDAPEARRLYGGLRNSSVKLTYSVSSHHSGHEIFVYSDKLELPMNVNNSLSSSSERFVSVDVFDTGDTSRY